MICFFFFFQAEDGIRDVAVTGVQTCALPICGERQPESLGGREFRTDMLTERILARPEALRETLADDHHAARLIGIVIAERTAAEDRDAQSAKVIGTDHPEVRVGPFAWRAGRPPLNAD